jgi:hypothetical protein
VENVDTDIAIINEQPRFPAPRALISLSTFPVQTETVQNRGLLAADVSSAVPATDTEASTGAASCAAVVSNGAAVVSDGAAVAAGDTSHGDAASEQSASRTPNALGATDQARPHTNLRRSAG